MKVSYSRTPQIKKEKKQLIKLIKPCKCKEKKTEKKIIKHQVWHKINYNMTQT